MASITAHTHFENWIVTKIQNVMNIASDAIEKRRVFARTLAELETLNDRELADLGLSRTDLRSVAKEAAYGA